MKGPYENTWGTLLLCVSRDTGSGNVTMYADATVELYRKRPSLNEVDFESSREDEAP